MRKRTFLAAVALLDILVGFPRRRNELVRRKADLRLGASEGQGAEDEGWEHSTAQHRAVGGAPQGR